MKRYHKRYHKEHPEERTKKNQRIAELKKKNKQKAVDYLGGKCIHCHYAIGRDGRRFESDKEAEGGGVPGDCHHQCGR